VIINRTVLFIHLISFFFTLFHQNFVCTLHCKIIHSVSLARKIIPSFFVLYAEVKLQLCSWSLMHLKAVTILLSIPQHFLFCFWLAKPVKMNVFTFFGDQRHQYQAVNFF
jgi:hypothetical protein